MSSRREAIREQCRGMEENLNLDPVEIPGRCERPLTLKEEMMRFVKTEMRNNARIEEKGTFEEEDDFEIENDDPDLTSPYIVHELISEEGEPYALEGTEEKENGPDRPYVLDEQGYPKAKEEVLSEPPEEVNSQTEPQAQFGPEDLAKLKAFLASV